MLWLLFGKIKLNILLPINQWRNLHYVWLLNDSELRSLCSSVGMCNLQAVIQCCRHKKLSLAREVFDRVWKNDTKADEKVLSAVTLSVSLPIQSRCDNQLLVFLFLFSLFRLCTGWAKNGLFLEVCNSHICWHRLAFYISNCSVLYPQ